MAAPEEAAQVAAVLTTTREAIAGGVLTASGIGALIFRRWSRGQQRKRNGALAQKGRLLLVALPKGSKARPEASQEVFLGLRRLLQQSNRQVLFGNGYHLSLEITKSVFGLATYIWVPDLSDEGMGLVREVSNRVRAVYPDAYVGVVDRRPEKDVIQGETGVVWADLKLNRPGYYPIRTEFVKGMDAVRTLMQALAAGGDITGSGVQFLMRPAGNGWQRAGANKVQNTQQKWKEASTPRSMIPDAEKDLMKLIEQKKDQMGYDVVVRVWVTGHDPEKIQMRLGELIRSFDIFSYDQGNSFGVADQDSTTVTPETWESTPVFGRFYPAFPEVATLNPEELSVAWHLPDDTMPIPGLIRGQARAIPPAVHLIPGQIQDEDDYCVLGEHRYADGSRTDEVGLEWLQMEKHTYILGPNGTGKSTLLHWMALQSLEAGQSTIVFDPHSKLVYDIAATVPAEHEDDVILIDFSDARRKIGINIFDMVDEGGEDLDRLAAEIMTLLQKVVGANWDVAVRMQRLFRNVLSTLLGVMDQPTMVEFYKMFSQPLFSEDLSKQVTDPILSLFWESWNEQDEKARRDAFQTPLTRLETFLTNRTVRRIVGQGETTLALRKAMDQGKMVLIDVGVSKMGEANAEFIGTVMMSLLRMSAMGRLRLPPSEMDQLPRTIVIIDEAHRFMVGDEARQMLSEMRKTHTGLLFATQYDKQFPDEVREAVRGNVGSFVGFRLGRDDARFWGTLFDVKTQEMLNLPRFGIYAWSDSKIGSAKTFPPPDTVTALPSSSSNGHGAFNPQGQEKEMADLLKRLKGMGHRQRVETLVGLSDDEWETYRRVRKAMDEAKLAQLKADPSLIPDKVARIKAKTLLEYGTPSAEADADVTRRTSVEAEQNDDWLNYD
jgi:energy-coupling factor transporter ATP-binding protein EcfA2